MCGVWLWLWLRWPPLMVPRQGCGFVAGPTGCQRCRAPPSAHHGDPHPRSCRWATSGHPGPHMGFAPGQVAWPGCAVTCHSWTKPAGVGENVVKNQTLCSTNGPEVLCPLSPAAPICLSFPRRCCVGHFAPSAQSSPLPSPGGTPSQGAGGDTAPQRVFACRDGQQGLGEKLALHQRQRGGTDAAAAGLNIAPGPVRKSC